MLANIIDNIMKPQDFKKVQKTFTSPDMDWKLAPVLSDEQDIKYENKNYQLAHNIYWQSMPHSKTIELLSPIFEDDRLKIFSIHKIKANCNVWTPEIYEHGMHVDVNHVHKPFPYLWTGIFYLNTCDGYTLLENGEKIDSIENRFVFFPMILNHTGTTVTNAPYRIVINFNFVSYHKWPTQER